MQVENISKISFGIRPSVNVSQKNSKLLNEVADRFDILNQKLDKTISKEIRRNTTYYIEEKNNDILTFAQGGYAEHSIRFAKEFLNQPAKKIAQTLAKAAKIFSYDDKLFEKTCTYINSINTKKPPQVAKGYVFEDDIWSVYEKHIVTAIKKEFSKDKKFKMIEEVDI